MSRTISAIAILFAAHLAVAAAAQTNPYLEAGIPPVTRPWSGPDYTRTAEVLTAGKVPLPRFADPQGAALLGRVTSTDSLSPLRDKSVPLPARLQNYRQVSHGATQLLILYASAREGNYQPELARIAAFLLHCAAEGVDLIDEFMPTLPRNETYATKLETLRKVNDDLARMFVRTEQMLTEQKGYSADDLSVLLDGMATTLPRIKKVFPPEVRINLRKKFEADKARFKKDEDTHRLDQIIAELGEA